MQRHISTLFIHTTDYVHHHHHHHHSYTLQIIYHRCRHHRHHHHRHHHHPRHTTTWPDPAQLDGTFKPQSLYINHLREADGGSGTGSACWTHVLHVRDAHVAHVAVGVGGLPGGEDGACAVHAVEVGLEAAGVWRQHINIEDARRPPAHEQHRLALELPDVHRRQLRTLRS